MKKLTLIFLLLTNLAMLFLIVSCDSSPATPTPATSIPAAPPAPLLALAGEPDEINASDSAEIPHQDKVLLWLDATTGVTVDESGRVTSWHDKLNDTPFIIEGTIVENALNGLPIIRMEGGQGINFEPDLEIGPATTFVVFQRQEEQAVGPTWQRLISVWDGQGSSDLVLPSYSYFLDKGDEIIEPSVAHKTELDGGRIRFTIGMDAIANKQNFYGDIAEVIIYEEVIVSLQQLEEIYHYLSEKWGAGADYEAGEGVTRARPLTGGVARANHNYPLSDQDNSEGWSPFLPWTDEIDDGVLDVEKWLPHNHVWYGREPCIFLPENISEGNGILTVAMKKDPSLPVEDFYKKGDTYHDYSCATLSSLDAKRYGYIEARARAGVGSSAFWLYAESYKEGLHNSLEIDVYELGGVQDGYETMYNMNAWVHALEGDQRRFDIGERWDSGIRFADDFHVFGLKWTEEELEYYLDGVLVRTMPNLHWHSPLLLLFDTETMPEWFLIPDNGDLPGYHEIDYVRAWTNAETIDTWQGEYRLKNDPRTNNPTAAYVSQFPGHVDQGTPGPLYNRVWCHKLPASMPVQSQLSADVDYAAEVDDALIVVEIWQNNSLVGQGQSSVQAGFGTTPVTINLPSEPPEGADYAIHAGILPPSGNIADYCQRDFIIGDFIPVTGISNVKQETISPGDTVALQVDIQPTNATNQTLIWRSENEGVAVVDNAGVVTGAAEGEALIIITSADGSFTTTTTVMVTADGDNLILNGGFESGALPPWTYYGAVKLSTENRVGESAYSVSVKGQGAVEQLVTVKPNTTYKMRGFGRMLNDGQKVFFGVKDYDGTSTFADTIFTSTTFEEGSVTFTTGPDNATALVYFYVEAPGATAFGDDFALTEE